VKKRSSGSYRGQKCTLKAFFNAIDKNIENINMLDVKNYFSDVLDKKNIKLKTKEMRRSHLKSFFYYVQALMLDRGVEYQNPIPNKLVYQFTKKPGDIKKQSQIKEKIISSENLESILKYAKKNLRKKYFILFALLICTGARHSEIRSIRLSNIHMKERYFETGFEKDARKSTLKSEEGLLFFFPRQFSIYLNNYILSLKGEEKWLFPAVKSEGKYAFLNESALYHAKKKIERGLGFHFKMHRFRHTLVNNRLIKMQCPLWLSEGLTNHKVSESTQVKHYASLTIKQKRALYDKYFPYREIPFF